ncbi:DNA polymerase III subunit delta' [Anaerocolumna xylanovorans]|uniref:DNA polymerase-3 subunit delta n=1 Tax=Anaerocolumna xylanovorans DSM 12503 TaxID=1121345 RepID=A0A1M7YKE8_9FIRM|nr:DNA polymerase III subunit delta' [Anaerocolumna xylanovorans]SHO53099.1 DNA polymerase-3 subunit delta' [Anaerocolumna xylanovorans DSM 12503]
MAEFHQIIGHEQIIEHLKTAIRTQTVSHAYIFAGEEGMGKRTLAAAFTKGIQCENKKEDGDSCGTCKSCLQAESKNHPDIIYVTHEKASLGVDDIRSKLNNDILVKPYSSSRKIYIIEDGEKMTEQAQNALLKTLETPPAYAVIILLTNNINAFLPTILSRCVILKLNPVKEEDIKNYLMQVYKIPDYQAELSAVFSQGNVGRAISYSSSENFAAMKDKVLHLLRYIDQMELYELIEGLKDISEQKGNIEEYLDLITLWFRDILMFKVTKDMNLLLYKGEYSEIVKQANKRSYEGLEEIIKAVEKAKIRINANVNFDIVMELMFLTIKEN